MRIAARHYSDEGHLRELERALECVPDSVEVLFERASCLEDLGWDERASDAYLQTLQRDPHHFGALTNLGLMFFNSGDAANARAFFTVALTHHPLTPIAHVNLAQVLCHQGEFASAIAHYEAALKLAPHDFSALHGLAMAYEATGDARAPAQFERAFHERSAWTLPYAGSDPRFRVLLLVSGRGGDIVSHPFLDNRRVETTMFAPEGWRDGMALPPHDVVFNGIGDADRCARSLERAVAALAATSARVINDPRRVLATGRVRVAERLAALPGIVVPRIACVSRAACTAGELAAAGWTFPLLVRALGYQAGRYFERVDTAVALPAALARLPGDAILAIGVLDARGADGCARKYRVLGIGGRLYPVHLAIADDWKVHYFSAGMDARADRRAEEQAFLSDMRAVLGDERVAALERIVQTLGLEYCGIDLGIDRAGRLLVFEANATMAVYPPPEDPIWAYRRPAYDAVIAAVTTLINSG